MSCISRNTGFKVFYIKVGVAFCLIVRLFGCSDFFSYGDEAVGLIRLGSSVILDLLLHPSSSLRRRYLSPMDFAKLMFFNPFYSTTMWHRISSLVCSTATTKLSCRSVCLSLLLLFVQSCNSGGRKETKLTFEDTEHHRCLRV